MSEENKLVFTAADFVQELTKEFGYESAARAANFRFNQWLNKQVVVYGKNNHGTPTMWSIDDSEIFCVTHIARLCNITKIEGEKE